MKNVVDVAPLFFLPFSTMPLSQLVSISGSAGRTRISVISLPKFNFLSSLTHYIFSCNFSNTVAEIQFLSSFFQITLNSTYNNNKLRFLQFLAERLENISATLRIPLKLKIVMATNLIVGFLFWSCLLFNFLFSYKMVFNKGQI